MKNLLKKIIKNILLFFSLGYAGIFFAKDFKELEKRSKNVNS